MYDLIIVGGGPAGLTAAIYSIRKRLNVLLVTKDLGGKTNYHLALPWLEEYQVIRGVEVVSKFRNELEYLDFSRVMDSVEHIECLRDHFAITTRQNNDLLCRAVIIATGANQQRLNVPGEKEYLMRGLCYSALSYAPLFIDRTAVVIGEGDLALRSAGELATIARRVYIVCESGEFLTSPLGEKLEAALNVTILEGYKVTEFKGDAYARSMALTDPTGQPMEIKADGFFVEKDLIPNSKMAVGLTNLDSKGRIKVDCSACAEIPGLFAAGDVASSHAEQVLVAVGEGAKAALSAYEYLLPML
jgi:NADH-dependent peroxiredoxin subunit F